MLLAQKIELRPDKKQIAYLEQAFGCRRHAFNNLLAHFSKPENKWYKKAAVKYFMDIMRVEFSFYSDISSRITRNTIDDLDNAFNHFFRRAKAGQNPGFPKFKKKGIKERYGLDMLKPGIKRTEELCKPDSGIVGIGVDAVNNAIINVR